MEEEVEEEVAEGQEHGVAVRLEDFQQAHAEVAGGEQQGIDQVRGQQQKHPYAAQPQGAVDAREAVELGEWLSHT